MSGISDSISDFKNTVSGVVDSGRGWVDDLSGALDFGSNAPEQPATPVSRAPERDISEIDRANPTNTNFPMPFNLPAPVVYGVGAIAGLIILKKLKVF